MFVAVTVPAENSPHGKAKYCKLKYCFEYDRDSLGVPLEKQMFLGLGVV